MGEKKDNGEYNVVLNCCEGRRHKKTDIVDHEISLAAIGWFMTLTHSYQAPHPLMVLGLVAKYKNKRLKDTTIILIVDGLQALINDGQDLLECCQSFTVH